VKNSVSHYTDGRNAWKIGVVGLLVRIKGIVGTGVITVIAMGVPWWWPNNFPATVAVNLKYFFLVAVFTFGSILTYVLFYLRKRSMRSLGTKYYLHQLVHDIRDKQSDLHKKLAPGKGYSKGKLSKELEILLTQICENAATYFKLLTDDESIGASIRLASLGEDGKTIVYKTFARSKGLNAHRKKHSEAIPINKGIPRFLREDKSAQGILVYYDMKAASDAGAYIMTKNDELYPDEIVTMMVAPMNAWSGIKQDMIGIMYITSRESSTFEVKHVDSLAFLADLTASAVANTMELVRLKCNNPELTRGGEYAKAI